MELLSIYCKECGTEIGKVTSPGIVDVVADEIYCTECAGDKEEEKEDEEDEVSPEVETEEKGESGA